jgi:hypothetical protein
MSDRDIRQAAALLIDEYGLDAASEVMLILDRKLAGGDGDAAARWAGVLDAITAIETARRRE